MASTHLYLFLLSIPLALLKGLQVTQLQEQTEMMSLMESVAVGASTGAGVVSGSSMDKMEPLAVMTSPSNLDGTRSSLCKWGKWGFLLQGKNGFMILQNLKKMSL